MFDIGFKNWLNEDSFYEVLKFAYLKYRIVNENVQGIDDSPTQRVFLKLFEAKSIADLASEDIPSISASDEAEDEEFQKLSPAEQKKQIDQRNKEREASRQELIKYANIFKNNFFPQIQSHFKSFQEKKPQLLSLLKSKISNKLRGIRNTSSISKEGWTEITSLPEAGGRIIVSDDDLSKFITKFGNIDLSSLDEAKKNKKIDDMAIALVNKLSNREIDSQWLSVNSAIKKDDPQLNVDKLSKQDVEELRKHFFSKSKIQAYIAEKPERKEHEEALKKFAQGQIGSLTDEDKEALSYIFAKYLTELRFSKISDEKTIKTRKERAKSDFDILNWERSQEDLSHYSGFKDEQASQYQNELVGKTLDILNSVKERGGSPTAKDFESLKKPKNVLLKFTDDDIEKVVKMFKGQDVSSYNDKTMHAAALMVANSFLRKKKMLDSSIVNQIKGIAKGQTKREKTAAFADQMTNIMNSVLLAISKPGTNDKKEEELRRAIINIRLHPISQLETLPIKTDDKKEYQIELRKLLDPIAKGELPENAPSADTQDVNDFKRLPYIKNKDVRNYVLNLIKNAARYFGVREFRQQSGNLNRLNVLFTRLKKASRLENKETTNKKGEVVIDVPGFREGNQGFADAVQAKKDFIEEGFPKERSMNLQKFLDFLRRHGHPQGSGLVAGLGGAPKEGEVDPLMMIAARSKKKGATGISFEGLVEKSSAELRNSYNNLVGILDKIIENAPEARNYDHNLEMQLAVLKRLTALFQARHMLPLKVRSLEQQLHADFLKERGEKTSANQLYGKGSLKNKILDIFKTARAKNSLEEQDFEPLIDSHAETDYEVIKKMYKIASTSDAWKTEGKEADELAKQVANVHPTDVLDFANIKKSAAEKSKFEQGNLSELLQEIRQSFFNNLKTRIAEVLNSAKRKGSVSLSDFDFIGQSAVASSSRVAQHKKTLKNIVRIASENLATLTPNFADQLAKMYMDSYEDEFQDVAKNISFEDFKRYQDKTVVNQMIMSSLYKAAENTTDEIEIKDGKKVAVKDKDLMNMIRQWAHKEGVDLIDLDHIADVEGPISPDKAKELEAPEKVLDPHVKARRLSKETADTIKKNLLQIFRNAKSTNQFTMQSLEGLMKLQLKYSNPQNVAEKISEPFVYPITREDIEEMFNIQQKLQINPVVDEDSSLEYLADKMVENYLKKYNLQIDVSRTSARIPPEAHRTITAPAEYEPLEKVLKNISAEKESPLAIARDPRPEHIAHPNAPENVKAYLKELEQLEANPNWHMPGGMSPEEFKRIEDKVSELSVKSGIYEPHRPKEKRRAYERRVSAAMDAHNRQIELLKAKVSETPEKAALRVKNSLNRLQQMYRVGAYADPQDYVGSGSASLMKKLPSASQASSSNPVETPEKQNKIAASNILKPSASPSSMQPASPQVKPQGEQPTPNQA